MAKDKDKKKDSEIAGTIAGSNITYGQLRGIAKLLNPPSSGAPAGGSGGSSGVYSPPGKSGIFVDEKGNADPKNTWGGQNTIDQGGTITKSGQSGWGGGGGSSMSSAEIAKQQKALQLKAEQAKQMSENTTYSFNPASISGFKKTFKDLQLQLDSINNDPYKTKETRNTSKDALLNSYSKQLSGLFNTPEEFQAAQKDPSMQKLLAQYQGVGGDTNDILSNLTNTVTVTGETPNPDGSYNVSYSDGTTENRRYTQNADGSYTSSPAQSVDQYLGNITTPAQQKAYDSLIPEKQIAQEKIAFEQSIPEQYRQLYFGTPEQMGLVQQKKQEADQAIKLLERKAKLDERNAAAQVSYLKEKNNFEMQKQEAMVEENRLNAKNYMTGMLAKLGALKTTGAAPLALVTLEQKYQRQASELRTEFYLANRAIEVKLNETVDNINLTRDENILKTKQDLSKSEEDVWKEIFKLQNAADKATFGIIEGYTKDFRTQTDKYSKELKAAAKKNLNSMSSVISEFNIGTFNDAIRGKEGTLNNLTSQERTRLLPGFINKAVSSGGLATATQKVLLNEKGLGDYSKKTQDQIRYELDQLGISISDLGSVTKKTKEITYDQLEGGKWRVSLPNGTSYISATDPRGGTSTAITSGREI